MTDLTFRRDKTPYFVFQCERCEQYSYVKTTQKAKKCLRCGKTYHIAKIRTQKEVETVLGMTLALERVKELQSRIAWEVDFRSPFDFKRPPKSKSRPLQKARRQISREVIDENTYETLFQNLLTEISHLYSSFPFYALEILNDKSKIPIKTLTTLVKSYLKRRKLALNRRKRLFIV
ncbi:MAG: hypothetical protein GF383_06870 [Candidatus Lokiarchaeota archaeon]|nr:hypothetical protein [Candidatus Lokiarchaeota archaeon]